MQARNFNNLSFAIGGVAGGYRSQSATIRTSPALQRGSGWSELDAESGNEGIKSRDGVGTSIYLELQWVCNLKGYHGITWES